MKASIAEPFDPVSVRCREHGAPAGLLGSALARRFLHWRGASGRRHLFSVFPLGDGVDDSPRFEDAVVLAVARGPAGERRVVLVDETGPLPDLFFAGGRFRAAVARGANEIHVHLLAGDRAARVALVRDLSE